MREDELRQQLKEHHGRAFGWALSCCDWDTTLAEDVLQSAYLKVLDGSARFGERSSFKTWLYAVIRRTVSEVRRRRAVHRFVPAWVLTEKRDTKATDPIEEIVRSQTNAQLVSALKSLSKRQQELLHLVFYQDLTIREAAEVAGVSIGTARTHYDRGKKQLRKLLQKEKDHERPSR